jgi:hypothetical protein
MRLGLLDVGAAGALLVALVLPRPSLPVKSLYTETERPLVEQAADAQADLARRPSDGRAAARLADALERLRQSDWGVSAAASASQKSGPETWRAQLAVSSAYGQRLEVGPAALWAKRALQSCNAQGAECADFERMRVEMYVTALEAGLASGIDPRREPQRFEDAVRRAAPLLRVGPGEARRARPDEGR